ncbi:MAG: diguanylate cyclase [Defluviitaleaceae bacterium]|nr:diguanylate cyclase [Defluviitaleaceae bacterium]
MLTTTLSVILIFSIVVLVFLIAFTLFRCESKKKNIFILMLIPVIFYQLGYLFEINSTTVEEVFLGRRLAYLGIPYIAPLLLLFVVDYFNIKVKKAFVALLLAFPLFITFLVWTSDWHNLFYVTIWLDTDTPLTMFGRESGPFNLLGHLYTMACFAAVIVLLTYKNIKSDKLERSGMRLMTIGTLFAVGSNLMYLVAPFGLKINYGAVTALVFALFLCINTIKYDMFDILPRASALALNSITEAFILIDRSKNFINANESAKKLIPSMGNTKNRLLVGLDDWSIELSLAIEQGRIGQVSIATDNGKHYEASIDPVTKERDVLLGHIIIIRDITESIMFTKQLEKLAYTDMLTGAMNRQHFTTLASTQLERVKRSEENAFIIMFDIDHFKKINDTHGHLAGDKVLQAVSESVTENIRPYDLFGRFGGEEFILFAFDMSQSDIKEYTERLRTTIQNKLINVDDAELAVTASFGVAQVDDKLTLEEIIAVADKALYKAKSEGRNQVGWGQRRR